MIRQAHTYLAGAVSGTALIGAAVVAFVLLVSLQALRDWPLAGIGGSGDSAAVSSGRPADGAGPTAGPTGALGAAAGSASPQAQAKGGGNSVERVGDGGTTTGTGVGTPPSTEPPVAEVPAPTPGSAGSPSPASSSPASSSGNNNNGGGAGPGTSSAGGGGAGGGSSTSGAVAGTVNNTVSGVDKVVGGALTETGVTQVTEEVVDGVAGPSSPVGKTVDKVVETVGGLLGGKR